MAVRQRADFLLLFLTFKAHLPRQIILQQNRQLRRARSGPGLAPANMKFKIFFFSSHIIGLGLVALFFHGLRP